jgi:hypothetical protein
MLNGWLINGDHEYLMAKFFLLVYHPGINIGFHIQSNRTPWMFVTQIYPYGKSSWKNNKANNRDTFRKNYVFMSHKTAASGPVGLLGLMQIFLIRAPQQGNRYYIHESDEVDSHVVINILANLRDFEFKNLKWRLKQNCVTYRKWW